jgi:hypothetical protein
MNPVEFRLIGNKMIDSLGTKISQHAGIYARFELTAGGGFGCGSSNNDSDAASYDNKVMSDI